MKNNTFKRVMAGTLAVLTVASPMTANVGGFLTGSVAIVASAKDATIVAPTGTGWLNDTLQSGDFFENDVELHKADVNTDTFKVAVDGVDFGIVIPADSIDSTDSDILKTTLEAYDQKVTALKAALTAADEAITDLEKAEAARTALGNAATVGFDSSTVAAFYASVTALEHTSTNEGVTSALTELKSVAEAAYTIMYGIMDDYGSELTGEYITTDEQGFIINNVKDIKYIAANADTTAAKKLEITALDITGKNSKKITLVTPDPANNFVGIASREVAGNTYTYELEVKENATDGYTFDFTKAASYLEKVVYTFQGNKQVVTNEGAAAKAMTTVNVADRTDVTIVSTALLGGGLTNYTPTYANGKYTYNFKAVSDKEAELATEAVAPSEFAATEQQNDDVKISVAYVEATTTGVAGSTVKVIKPTDSKEAEYTTLTGGTTYNKIVLGSTVTVVSDKPFTIADGAIDSQNEDGSFKKKKVIGVYTEGAFKATFVVAGDLNVATTAMPSNLTYTGSGTANITANATEDDVKIVENAPVASVTATAKVPVYADADKTVITKDSKNQNVYTETALANNASIAYNKDHEAFIDVDFDLDPNLLGFSGTAGTGTDAQLQYKAVVTKNGSDAANKVVDTYTWAVTGGASGELVKSTVGAAGTSTETYGTPSTKGFNIKIRNAGTYKVELYVWGTDNTAVDAAKIATTSFTVTPATNVTESDVTFRGFYADKIGTDNDGVGINTYYGKTKAYKKALEDATTDADKEAAKKEYTEWLKANALGVTKNSKGIYEVESEATKLADDVSKTVTIIAELADGTTCEVTGTKTAGTQNTTNNAAVVVTDPNYNVSPISIQWQLVEKKVANAIMFDVTNAAKFVNSTGVEVASDAAGDKFIPTKSDDIESVVKQFLTSTNGIDVSGATFKYATSKIVSGGTVDIDALTNGLPTAESIEKDTREENITYYIYANVGTYETAEPLAIYIAEDTADVQVETILTKKTYTYGEVIKPEDLAFVKAGTDTVVEGLKLKGNLDSSDFASTSVAFTADPLDEKTTEKVYYTIKKYKADGSVDTATEILNQSAGTTLLDDHKAYLEPGRYQVTVRATDKALDIAKGYDVVNKATDATSVRTFDITVEKKQLDASMFPEIEVLIDPTTKVAKLTDAALNSTFKPNGVQKGVTYENPTVKIAGLDSSALAPGSYTVEIGVAGDWAEKYTGTCKVQWRAVTTADPVNCTPKFATENDNIYKDKNEIYIHADVQLKNGEAKITADDFKALKVKEYGFVYEKEGALKDLTNADRTTAEKSLQLGVSKHVDTSKNTKSDVTIAGINSKVSSVEDYIWVRPYIMLEDGRVQYGDARRLDFETIANQVIQPNLANPMLVQKEVNGVDGIYYYAYASKVTKDKAGYRTAEPDAFGVIINRNGNYAAAEELGDDDHDGIGYNTADGTIDEGSDAEKLAKGEYVDTTGYSKEKLAAFNELKKAYAMTVDNRDVQSKAFNNDNYTADECGTLIRISDSLSRVYVRTYVDFGNGLVVYSDPKTAENASAALADAFEFQTTADVAASKYYMGATRKKAGIDVSAPQPVNTLKGVKQVFQNMKYVEDDVTAFGLIIDKSGKVAEDSYDPNNFILGNNFLEVNSVNPKATTTDKDSLSGNEADAENWITFGAVTTKGDTTISARSYMIYKGVTIYGGIAKSVDD